MSDSYYIQIQGKRYDRGIIEAANRAKESSAGLITKSDAEELLREVKDGNRYTTVEKSTVRYVRLNYDWAEDADEWFRSQIRSWAAERGQNATNTQRSSQPKQNTAATFTALQATEALNEEETNARFGELRSILQQSASPKVWDEFMVWCENNINALAAPEIQTYATDILGKWKNSFERLISPALLVIYLCEVDAPTWVLDHATGILIDQDLINLPDDTKDKAKKRLFKRLGQWKEAQHIDSWFFGTKDMELEGTEWVLEEMMPTKQWTHLKRIHIHPSYMDDDFFYVFAGMRLPNLEELHLGGFTNFSMGGYEDAFLNAKHLPHKIKHMPIHIERNRWDEYFECWE